jgi:hypothetical protein
MISTAKDGGTITNFSGRFSISGMTGTTPPTYEAAAKAVTGTDGPAAIDAIANNVAGAAPAAAAGPADQAAFAVPYAMQTGLTKYAPMQSTPPTKISVKNFSPLHPTSAFTIATTWMKKPTVVTTFTQSQTHSVSSRENPVSARLPSFLSLRVCCQSRDACCIYIHIFVRLFDRPLLTLFIPGSGSSFAYRRYAEIPRAMERLKMWWR